MTTEQIDVAMQHSKPCGEIMGIPLRVIDREFLSAEVMGIMGYPDAPEKEALLINADEQP